MTPTELDELLGECLADYHHKCSLGQPVAADAYRERLGDAFPAFLDLLDTASEIDRALEPTLPALPQNFGRYTLLSELGRGAMGVVYRAFDRELGRTVALKMLRAGVDLDEQAMRRFRNEARSSAQVSHPGIVTVHDAGAINGRLYFTMDVVEGENLTQLLRRGALPPAPDVLRGFADLADGIQALHEKGVVHRDIKPSNIMLAPGGRMVLTDFGLARTLASESITRTGDSVGTPLYMSPEQVLGRDVVDARSDIYGLGATLYEVFSGRTPYIAKDFSELYQCHKGPRPPALRAVAPQVPRHVSNVVMKALEREKRDRFQSAAAMRVALDLLARGEDPEIRAVTRLIRGLRWARKRAPALVAAAVVLVGLFAWWARRPGTVIVANALAFPMEVVRASAPGELAASGASPLVADLPPEEYVARPALTEVEAAHLDWNEPEGRIRLGAGERIQRNIEVSSKDQAGQEIVARRLARYAGGARDSIEVVNGAQRGLGLTLLWPRKNVRQEDLDEWAIDVGPMANPPRGEVSFEVQGRKATGTVRVDAAAGARRARGPLPADLRAALKPGDQVIWTFLADGGPRDAMNAPTARFTVVEAPDAERRLARLKEAAGDRDVRAEEARALLAEGLPSAAARRAESVPKASRGVLGWAVLAAAYYGMGAAGASPWTEAYDEFRVREKADPALAAYLLGPLDPSGR